MGIYRGQFLIGDRVSFRTEEFWIISVQIIEGDIHYVLMGDDLNTLIVSNINHKLKLIERKVLGNNEILCNLCPLKDTIISNCNNFCTYKIADSSYFFVGDKINIDNLNNFDEVTAITLTPIQLLEKPYAYDISKTTFIQFSRFSHNYSIDYALKNYINDNKEIFLNTLNKDFIGADISVFFGRNYQYISKEKIKLRLRTKFPYINHISEHINYFKELLCDQEKLEKYRNSWKVWLE